MISPKQFLEQVELGAEVHPGRTPFDVAVQVGRFEHGCDLREFDEGQQAALERLYQAECIRFGWPGDFVVRPFFFSRPLRTVRADGVSTVP